MLETVALTGFHILATTRKEDAVPGSSRWRSFPVPPMTLDNSLLILKKCCKAVDSLPRESASQVRHRSGFYRPFAVSRFDITYTQKCFMFPNMLPGPN